MNPTIVIAYIAVRDNPLLVSHATHFVDSYLAFPPGASHRLVVMCNGGVLPLRLKTLFDRVPHELVPRVNDAGWDVSAYIDAANLFKSDLQVCLGESVYFHRTGWLQRLVDCWTEFGEGMYGFFSSFLVRPHLNTTAFAVSPRYLLDFPKPTNRAERYQFEHGHKSLWRTVSAFGGATKLVTWDGCYDPQDWRKPDNILWRGDQSNLLVHANHTDKFTAATPKTRERWSLGADTLCR